MTQEALTNVARHAQAQRAEVRLVWSRPAPQALALDWSVVDDGVGIADPTAALRRGNGLAGLKERAWAAGGDLQIGPAPDDGSPPSGLRLQASFLWSVA